MRTTSIATRALALMLFATCCWAGWAADASAQSELAERFWRMGRDALNNRDWTECIEYMTQVVEIDDEFIDAYMDLAYCQEEMDQFREAVDTYREALKIAGDDRKPEILSRMAYAAATGGRPEKAVEIYEELVELTPDDKVALEGLAYTYKNLGRNAEAIVAYQRALELAPDDINLYRTLGELCREAEMPEQAARYYEKWMELEPDNVEPARHLATMYATLGVCDKGKELYDRVIALDPSNPGDLLNYGFLLGKCGDSNGALEKFEQYRKLRPDDSQVDCRIVFLYEDVGNPAKGIEVAKQSLENYPGDPCILLGYARLLDKQGQALEKNKDFEGALVKYRQGMAKAQKVISDEEFGTSGQKQVERFEQLINRAEKLKLREEQGY